MTRFDYQLRELLYFAIAVIGTGGQFLPGHYREAATVLSAGLLAYAAAQAGTVLPSSPAS